MSTFKKLPNSNNIQELIRSTFDTDLALDGDWGYTQDLATIIRTLPEGMPLVQLEHMITSIRAHLEMNLTQEEKKRYGAINANERSRERFQTTEGIFDKVSYEITAIKEDIYKALIKEYKEGYGKESFDLNEHFKKREEATLSRQIIHYFEVSQLQ